MSIQYGIGSGSSPIIARVAAGRVFATRDDRRGPARC
jgi:hypothetical protein